MKKLFWMVLATLALNAAPLHFSIQHPWRMAFYPLIPTTPAIEDSATVSIVETNDFQNEKELLLDYELTTLALTLSKKLDDKQALSLHIPFCRVWGGFMDAPLDWFHDATGLLNGAVHNIEGENRVILDFGTTHKRSSYSFLGNATITYKRLLVWHPFGADTAYRIGIKLPTAPKNSGFWTKRIDYLASLLVKYSDFVCNIDLLYLGRYNLAKSARAKRFAYSFYLDYTYAKWLFSWRYVSSYFSSRYAWFDTPSNVVSIAYSIDKHVRLFLSDNLAPFYGSPDFTIGVEIAF